MHLIFEAVLLHFIYTKILVRYTHTHIYTNSFVWGDVFPFYGSLLWFIAYCICLAMLKSDANGFQFSILLQIFILFIGDIYKIHAIHYIYCISKDIRNTFYTDTYSLIYMLYRLALVTISFKLITTLISLICEFILLMI
jgi:hypothetical protein